MDIKTGILLIIVAFVGALIAWECRQNDRYNMSRSRVWRRRRAHAILQALPAKFWRKGRWAA